MTLSIIRSFDNFFYGAGQVFPYPENWFFGGGYVNHVYVYMSSTYVVCAEGCPFNLCECGYAWSFLKSIFKEDVTSFKKWSILEYK